MVRIIIMNQTEIWMGNLVCSNLPFSFVISPWSYGLNGIGSLRYYLERRLIVSQSLGFYVSEAKMSYRLDLDSWYYIARVPTRDDQEAKM
jgi:hypothetical protein